MFRVRFSSFLGGAWWCVLKVAASLRVQVPSGEEPNPPVAGHSPAPRGIRAKRGVESLYGGSKRAGATSSELCSLVTFTRGEPSRSLHGEGHVWCSQLRRWCTRSPRGMGGGTFSRFGAEQERSVSAACVGQRPYKPTVKSSGAERKSEGAVVSGTGGQHNRPVGRALTLVTPVKGVSARAWPGPPGPTTPRGRSPRQSATSPKPAMGSSQAVLGVPLPCPL